MVTQTKRAEFQALQQEMSVEQETAIIELNGWFQSDEGKAFAEKMISVRERTIPGSHYDQILTSFLAVAGNVEKLAQQTADMVAAREAAANQAATPAAPTGE